MSRAARNWTIVSFLYRDPQPVSERHPAGWSSRLEKYVVLTGLKSRAQEIVGEWLVQELSRSVNLHDVHYYPRNYVDDYRQLVTAGRVIS